MVKSNPRTRRQPVPISVLIPVRDDAANLSRCLESVAGWADEILVVDSHSVDDSAGIASQYGARVIQFDYKGGWPKKRQWALDNHPWRNEWILLLDADEMVTDEARHEIAAALANPQFDGYWLRFRIYFLGRCLRFGGTELRKLALFRKAKGHYEKRLADQDTSMADMEIHEHVVVDGATSVIRSPIRHENINSLDRYIDKHNAYSNWEARVYLQGSSGEVQPSLFGNQSQRRRWLKTRFLMLPGASLLMFLHGYIFKLGILDGYAGLVYAMFRGVQMFHTKAKIHETRIVQSHIGQSVPTQDRDGSRRVMESQAA